MTNIRRELERRYTLASRKKRLDSYFFWVSDAERDWVVREILGQTLMFTGMPDERSFEQVQRCLVQYRALPVYSPSFPPPGMRKQKMFTRRITRVPAGL